MIGNTMKTHRLGIEPPPLASPSAKSSKGNPMTIKPTSDAVAVTGAEEAEREARRRRRFHESLHPARPMTEDVAGLVEETARLQAAKERVQRCRDELTFAIEQMVDVHVVLTALSAKPEAGESARHQPQREAVPRETHNIISSHVLGGWMCADCGMKEPKLSLRECPATLTTPAPAEDDDPDDHLGGKLAAAVERELDRIEQRNSTRQDFTPAFDRELARKVIMAGFGLFSCRGWTTASGYQWMGLLETLGLDKARPVSAAPAVSTDEIDELLYSVIRMPLSNKGSELVRWRKTMSGRLSAILTRLRGEGE
jgi:hypothetical protein